MTKAQLIARIKMKSENFKLKANSKYEKNTMIVK